MKPIVIILLSLFLIGSCAACTTCDSGPSSSSSSTSGSNSQSSASTVQAQTQGQSTFQSQSQQVIIDQHTELTQTILQGIQNSPNIGSSYAGESSSINPRLASTVRTTLGDVQLAPCFDIRPFMIVPDDINGTVAVGYKNFGSGHGDMSGVHLFGTYSTKIAADVSQGVIMNTGSVYVFRHVAIPSEGTLARLTPGNTIDVQREIVRVWIINAPMSYDFIENEWSYDEEATLGKLLSLQDYEINGQVRTKFTFDH